MHSALKQRIEMMRGKIERSASVVEVAGEWIGSSEV
ncbi:hypothetical protein DFO62_12334 [Serratia fonticola]|nr:hypothetical protein DFO62_12334 [Serratia fonticola]